MIHRRGRWRSIDDGEIATLEYVDRFNHRRLQGEIGHLPPAELEAAYTAAAGYTRPAPAATIVPGDHAAADPGG